MSRSGESYVSAVNIGGLAVGGDGDGVGIAAHGN
jgi:hypothetical protein